jgi:hypothetical protein
MCNSEPFVEAWINHYSKIQNAQLIIVEGATESWMTDLNWTSPRSTDKTIEIIKKYPNVQLVQLDRPYKDKLEMCNEAMKVINTDTDYVWQVDSDEFYLYNDINFILNELQTKEYTFVEFNMYHFWKYFDVIGKGGNGWAYDTPAPRLWKYHNGASFREHRPPTILNEQGIDYKNINPLLAKDNPVICRHYSYMFEQQVREKMQYYAVVFSVYCHVNGINYMDWFRNCWLAWTKDNRKEIEAKYSIHPSNSGAYTVDINVEHPEVIQKLII